MTLGIATGFPRLRCGAVLTLLWLAFVVRGAWYSALQPAWEGYDEPYHFAALQHVASGQGLAKADTPISLEVQESIHLLPLPWMLQFHAISQPLTTHDAFWKLTAEERAKRIEAVHALNPHAGSQPATEPILNYESQQAPLYYWIFAVPMRWVSSLPLLSLLYLLRFVNVLVASLAIPIAYWIALRVLRSDVQALGVTGIIVLLPELMINVARVGNESLALVCYTAMLAAAVMAVQKPLSRRGWLLLGGALGCALLTKAYVLTAVPAVLLMAVVSAWPGDALATGRPKPAEITMRLAGALAIAGAIAGRWYWQLHRATGSWSGQGDEVAVRNLSMLAKLAALSNVNWKSGILSVLVSHVWFGAWSFLRVPDRVYVLSFGVIGLSIIGVTTRLWRGRGTPDPLRAILALAGFYVFFYAGLAYGVLVIFLNQGVSAITGWYLYVTVAAEVVLLVWGLEAFLPDRVVFVGLAVGLAVLDLYGTHALLMSYYTGFTAHVGDSVRPVLGVTLSHLLTIFDRLAQVRPPWLSVPALLTGWVGYWAATIGAALAVVLLFRKPSANV